MSRIFWHQAVAFDVRIQHCRRTQPCRQRAARGDRLDADDARGAHDAGSLHRTQSDRAGAHHHDVVAESDRNESRHGAEAGGAHAAQHREIGGRHGRDGGHTIPLERNHQVGETAGVVVLVDRRPVIEFADRQQRFACRWIHLADIAASAKAVVALSTVRRVRDEHAIARVKTPHRRADRLHHADAAVAQDPGCDHAAGTPDWSASERLVDDGVAALGRLRADDDHIVAKGRETNLADRRTCCGSDERAKSPAGQIRSRGGPLLRLHCAGWAGSGGDGGSPALEKIPPFHLVWTMMAAGNCLRCSDHCAS